METLEPSVPKLGRLLIVDDEVELMTVLCKTLAAQNYETTGFTRGHDALEALRTQEFDLLLTDMMMPGMDGMTLLRSALEIDPYLVGVVMTGQGTVQTAVEAMKLGAYDYVLKPFKLSALLPALARYMETRRLRLENLQLRQSVAIYELSQAIAFSLDGDIVLNKLVDGALEQCDADEASIMLPTQDGAELYIAIARGEGRQHLVGQRTSMTEGIAGWVASHCEPLHLQGRVHDPRYTPKHPRPEIGAAASVPMQIGSKLVGVLNVNSTRRQRPFALGQIKGLSILAGTAAAALEDAWLHKQVSEAEAKFRAIFENAVDGMFQMCPDGRLLMANSALARILGYDSPAELLAAGDDVARQLLPDMGGSGVFSTLLQAGEQVRGVELRVFRKQGESIWISSSARAVRDAQGQLLCYEGIIEDISARKRVEQQQNLRHSVTKILSRSATANDVAASLLGIIGQNMVWESGAVWAVDPQEGTPRCLRTWYKTPAAEQAGRIATPDAAQRSLPAWEKELLERVWSSGEPHWIADLSSQELESAISAEERATLRGWFAFPLQLGGANVGILEFFSHRAREAESDFIELLMGLGKQVAQYVERKRAEEELDRFFALSLDMLCIANFEGYFLRVNPAWMVTLGYAEEELLSRPFLEFVHPDDRAMTLMTAQAIAEGAEINSFENRYRCKDGSYKWILWLATADLDHQLIYAAAHDITERKQMEEALRLSHHDLERRVEERTAELAQANEGLQAAKEEADRANRAKSEFLSRMSHELRTPLNAVLGFGQMLEMDDLDLQQRANVGHIIKGGRHLLNLINEVLDLARIEAGRMHLSLEPVSVRDIMLESLALVRPLASQRFIEIELVDHPSMANVRFALADQQRLKQVLLNLLGNAIKYNHDGGKVSLSSMLVPASTADTNGTEQPEAPDGTQGAVRVLVRDTGPGIPREKMERLFVPFDRLGAEQTRVEGTGLGLALSRRLIEAMGGTMGVDSVFGQGSTFWFDLARTELPEELHLLDETPVDDERAVAASDGLQRRTVLYVEDNLSNLQLIEQILKRRPGVELLAAMQGSVGLELARQHRPDVVMLDIHLPDMSGYDVLLRLRADPETSDLPVLVLSADATPGQIERLLLAGATHYLTKPLDVPHLLHTLDETMAVRREADRGEHRGEH